LEGPETPGPSRLRHDGHPGSDVWATARQGRVCSWAGAWCDSVQVSHGGHGMTRLLCGWHRPGWEQRARGVLILLRVMLLREKRPHQSKCHVTRLLAWQPARCLGSRVERAASWSLCSGEPPAAHQRLRPCGWRRCQGNASDLRGPVSSFYQGDRNKERLPSSGEGFSYDHGG